MVIDLTAQLAPIGVVLVMALGLALVGILSCVDDGEVRELGHWMRTARATFLTALRSLLNAGRLPSAHRS